MIASQKPYYPALTGLRALAAYMVFFHHANPFNVEGWQRPLHLFTNELHAGVSLFFVLSGFLIYSRYANGVQQNKNWFTHYLQNRFARIYPLYFVILIVTIAVHIYLNELSAKDSQSVFTYLINFTLLQGFFDELKFTGIAQAWSLSVEETFYLLLPVIFVLRRRINLILLPFLLIATGLLLIFILSPFHFHGLFSGFHFMMVYTFFGRSFEFIAGILLAIYMSKQKFSKKNSPAITFIAIISFIILISFIACFSNEGASGIKHPAGLVINNFIMPLAEVALLYGLVKEKSILKQILSTPLFQTLGKSSYAFYLIHAGYFFVFLYHHISSHVFIIFLIMNVIAIVLYYYIEKPLQQKWRSA